MPSVWLMLYCSLNFWSASSRSFTWSGHNTSLRRSAGTFSLSIAAFMRTRSAGVRRRRPVSASRSPVVTSTGVVAVFLAAHNAWAALANFASLMAFEWLSFTRLILS